jgi:hypothetical protein
MIITRLTGGLGNQMFQYAAGLSLAHARRTVLKLDVTWFGHAGTKPHERYALSSFNLPEQFATEDEIEQRRGVPLTRVERWSAVLARAFHFYQYARRLERRGRVLHDAVSGFNPVFFEQPDDTYLHGNWQSEKFFAPVADQLRAHFSLRYPASPGIAALADRIRSGPSAFLHFRRGDYVTDPRYAREIGQPGAGYQIAAIRQLRERHGDVMLYVFSDDIETVAREFVPAGPHEFVREPPGTEPHQILRLMSLCDHAIIANSTFSWWGAWLGEKPGNLVVAPRRWFAEGSPYNARDLVPDRWVQL